MNSKVNEYIVRSLGSSGIAVIDHVIARELSHDLLWATPNNCLGDFSQARRGLEKFLGTLRRVETVEVLFEGRTDWVLTATRDRDALSQRIKHIVGLEVIGIRDYRAAAQATKEQPVAKTDEPPAHQCAERAEWFYKRGIRDPQLGKPPSSPPPSVTRSRAQR